MVLLSESSDWMDVLVSGMTGSRGDLTKAYFRSWSYADVVSLSVVSQLSWQQSKARLMSPLMEMTQHGPDIFRTK
jgi:hypothetical protein